MDVSAEQASNSFVLCVSQLQPGLGGNVFLSDSPTLFPTPRTRLREDHFRPALAELGYDSLWRKRPRANSHDGCCIAWRRPFELLATESVDFCNGVCPLQAFGEKKLGRILGRFSQPSP